MASTRMRFRTDGSPYFEIRVQLGRGKPQLTKNWDPPDGWSDRSIKRKLDEVATEFERDCKEGKVLSKRDLASKKAIDEATAPQILTVREYCETVFMPIKSITFSENARSSYQNNLDTWIYPALGDTKLPEVKAVQITALLAQMQALGRAHSTVKKVHTVLSSMFTMAYLGDVIDRNPMDKVAKPQPRKEEEAKDTPPSYTIEEIKHIFAVISGEPLKWRAYIHLVAGTGIRRGEACGLKWENVDFDTNTITIVGNLCYTPKRGVYLDTTKGKRRRMVRAAPETMALLAELKSTTTVTSEFVFTQEGSSSPIHPQSPTWYMSKLGKRCGINDFHPHKLRHSFASISIESGAAVSGVAAALGHVNSATSVRTYIHGTSKAQNEASQLVHTAIYGDIRTSQAKQ